MVRWVCVLLLSWSGLAVAAELHVQLPSAERPYRGELGRAITVELHYRGEADLQHIPLEPWQQDVVVDRGYVRRDDGQQRLRLRLTARRGGLLNLPPLQLGAAHTQATELDIGPAREGGELLAPSWQLSHRRAWQGEEILASLTLDSLDPDIRLATAEAKWPGFDVQGISASPARLEDGRLRHRFVWLLRARNAGELSLQAPELRYLRDGVPVRRFHFPVRALQVQAMPDYLPPTVPVGRLSAETDAEGKHWLLGHRIPANLLQSALERAHLRWSGIATEQGVNGTVSRARIDWSGDAPDQATLVYFDPQPGRLRQLELASPPPSLLWWLLPPGVGLLILLAGYRRRLWHWLRRLQGYRRLLRHLRDVEDAGALKGRLLGDGRSLARWQRDWSAAYHVPAQLDGCLSRLQACCYGRHCADPELPAALRSAIRQCRPRW